jgi:glycerol-3-phosphate dehydrogenase
MSSEMRPEPVEGPEKGLRPAQPATVARRIQSALPPPPLSPAGRTEALRRLAEEQFDVLVVGGGVTGCGAALDAVTRGLRVGLVEARDLAAGTSSRSTKLFHGGLRYLEQLNFALVFEALKERRLALETLCPHLAKPVPFLYPLTRPVFDRGYAGLGIGVYDVMGSGRGVPNHLRHLGKRKTWESFPSANREVVRGAISFYEGQVDDARHTMMIGRTAAHYGAAVATSTRVIGFRREADRVAGVRVRDLESGAEFEVRATQVINAAGVWMDELQEMMGGRGQFRVRASKGIHLLVPRNRINSRTGVITRTEKSLLFIIPWGDRWIIGTTDTDWALDRAHPAASSADIDYLLAHANRLLADPLDRDDVVGVYAGLRPLLAGESDSTSKLSREHAVASPVRGVITVAGGKYTTYRVMAKDAVDAAVADLDQKVPESCTEEVPLLGAEGYRALWNTRSLIAEETGLTPIQVEHLLNRYGSLLPELRALLVEQPELAAPLETAPGYLKVEVVYAAAYEGALHLDDVLARRTHISIETWDRGVAAATEVAPLVAPVLGWGDAEVAREIEHYEKRVAAERESQFQPDDLSADAARLGAPDVRMGRIA